MKKTASFNYNYRKELFLSLISGAEVEDRVWCSRMYFALMVFMSKTDEKFVWIAKFFFYWKYIELSVNTDSIMLARPPCLFINHHHYYDYRLIGVLAPAVSLTRTCLSNQFCWVPDVSLKCESSEDLITAFFCFTGRKNEYYGAPSSLRAKQAYSRCSKARLNSD